MLGICRVDHIIVSSVLSRQMTWSYRVYQIIIQFCSGASGGAAVAVPPLVAFDSKTSGFLAFLALLAAWPLAVSAMVAFDSDWGAKPFKFEATKP